MLNEFTCAFLRSERRPVIPRGGRLLLAEQPNQRKEVKTMTYVKPEITVLGDAASLIQGGSSNNKEPGGAQPGQLTSDCDIDD
jgi:hypothetical protein